MRLFGYFFGVEKVTRGTGLEAPKGLGYGGRAPEKRCGAFGPHMIQQDMFCNLLSTNKSYIA